MLLLLFLVGGLRLERRRLGQVVEAVVCGGVVQVEVGCFMAMKVTCRAHSCRIPLLFNIELQIGVLRVLRGEALRWFPGGWA